MSAVAVCFRAVRRVLASGTTLLDGVDLEVEAGAVLQIVGPSGAGKTTLLRLVNRLDDASSGTVEALGRPVRDWPPQLLRQRVGMMFQEPSLLERSVRDTLALPLELDGGESMQATARLEAATALAGLDTAWLDRDARQLSTGQKQLVCLARTLVHAPDLLLLDEPTAGLDPRTAERLLQRLAALNRDRGTTLLLVTHRLDEAPKLGGRLCVMIGGRIAAIGETERLLANPPAGPVADFLRGVDA